MRVFITGATGFIGRHVVDLVKEENDILALSRRIMEDGDVRWICGDLDNVDNIKDKVKEFCADTIIHLAWEGIPDYSYETSKKNLVHSLNILDLCRYAGCKALIVTGSCWEYLNPSGVVYEESALSYETSFSTAKNCFLKMTERFCSENDINYHWLRLFYVYGPGQRRQSIVPYLIENLRNGVVPSFQLHITKMILFMLKTLHGALDLFLKTSLIERFSTLAAEKPSRL